MLNLEGCREEVHVVPRLRHVEHGRAPSHCQLVTSCFLMCCILFMMAGQKEIPLHVHAGNIHIAVFSAGGLLVR